MTTVLYFDAPSPPAIRSIIQSFESWLELARDFFEPPDILNLFTLVLAWAVFCLFLKEVVNIITEIVYKTASYQ